MDHKAKIEIKRLEDQVQELSEKLVAKDHEVREIKANATPEAKESERVAKQHQERADQYRDIIVEIGEGKGKYSKLAREKLDELEAEQTNSE